MLDKSVFCVILYGGNQGNTEIRAKTGKEVTDMEITKNTIIGDILDADFEVAPYFLEMGMHCLGCPASRGESIEEACAVHGTDPEELVKKLNEHFANK